MITEIFESVLDELSINTNLLSQSEIKQIDQRGFILCKGLLSEEDIISLRKRFEQLFELEGPAAGVQFHQGSINLNRYGQEPGVRRLCDLVNKGEIFCKIFLNPKLIATATHVFQRDFKFSALNGRDVEQGQGLQKLHSDWRKKYDGNFHVFNSIWLLFSNILS